MPSSPWSTSGGSGNATASTTGLGTAAAVAAAALAASNAQTDANTANTALAVIANDNILSAGEKPAVILDKAAIDAEQSGIDGQATAYGITTEKTTYDNAVSALSTYLSTLSIPGWWNDTTNNTNIVGTTFRANFGLVYSTRQALLNKIYASAKALADAAQSTANGASSGVSQINSVDYITNADKIKLRQDWNDEYLNVKPQLDASADALGVSRTAYDNAVLALYNNIGTATGVGNWDVTWPDGTTGGPWTSIMINIRTWWGSIAGNRAALQKAIADKVQSNAAYADALARSTYNLIKNSNSEMANPTGLESGSISTSYPRNGSKSRAVVAPSAGVIGYQQVAEFPVTAGEKFYGETWVNNTSNTSGWLDVTFYNSAGGQTNSAATPANNSSSYTRTKGQFTAGTGAVLARVYLASLCSTGAGVTFHDDFYLGRMVGGALLEADAIQTSNYTEDGGGNPTAGARMDISATALKVASGNFQLGQYIFTDYFYRQLQAIDGSNGGRVVYRGNVDVSSRGGAPNIACLSVTRRRWDTTNKICRLEMVVQPSATGASDNLDSMRFGKVQLYRQSAAGTTATLTVVDTFFPALADRRYGNFGTDTDSSNAAYFTFETTDAAISSGVPAALITLYNAYGPSAGNCFYSPAGASDNTAMTNNGTTWPAGITGASGGSGGGGGGGGGGGCPAPWVRILLASGLLVEAADLHNGVMLAGVDDNTMEPKVGQVTHLQTIWRKRVAVVLEDGRAPEFSEDHRVAVMGRGFVAVQRLRPGDELVAQRPSIVRQVRPTGLGQVISFQVAGTGTYFTEDVLSHNLKALIS